ncbi:MAG: D-hexose-6-phosphate mutarotase [Rhodocyclaceae bacterium]|nr:D-hexose-6-phosphate mutarotase [Rhodocyclaceae bacterium]
MYATISETRFKSQPAVTIDTRDGAQAILSLRGGQLLHWQPAGGQPWLYLSEQACFDGSMAIRGGVPVCFPQFAQTGKLPRHGLVRTALWQLTEQRIDDDVAMLTLATASNDATRALWPFDFTLELTVAVGANRLDIELAVTNTGYRAFAFSAALHTYLRVAEVELALLSGLAGKPYRNALDNTLIDRDPHPALAVDGPIDRIYHAITRPLLLDDNSRHLLIVQEQFPDAVIWNPWEDGAAQLADMPDRDFRRMLCVEAAAVRERIELAADDTWWGRQSLIDTRVSTA